MSSTRTPGGVSHKVTTDLAKHIRERMGSEGVNQTQLAARIGVKQSAISNVIHCKVKTSAHIPAMLAALHTTWPPPGTHTREATPELQQEWSAMLVALLSARDWDEQRVRKLIAVLRRMLDSRWQQELLDVFDLTKR